MSETKRVIMKVKATAPDGRGVAGYFDHKRMRHGMGFTLSKLEQFSKKWMIPIGWDPEKLKAEQKAAAKRAADAKAKAEAEAEAKENTPEPSMDMTRDELVTIAVGMDIDPPDKANKSEILELIQSAIDLLDGDENEGDDKDDDDNE